MANFDGTGTVAIRTSFNISSITDNGTGDYTLTFTNAMTDANYCVVCATNSNNGDGKEQWWLYAECAPAGTATGSVAKHLQHWRQPTRSTDIYVAVFVEVDP